MQARLPRASSGPGTFCSSTRAEAVETALGRRRDPQAPHSLPEGGERGEGRGLRAGVAPRGLTFPSSCTGRSSTARPRLLAAPRTAWPAAGRGLGRGVVPTAAPRAPRPPAPRPACSGSLSAPATRARPPSRPSIRAAGQAGLGVRVGHVARPPSTRRGCPPITAAGAEWTSVPAAAARALKSASQPPGSGLSWGAAPAGVSAPSAAPHRNPAQRAAHGSAPAQDARRGHRAPEARGREAGRLGRHGEEGARGRRTGRQRVDGLYDAGAG